MTELAVSGRSPAAGEWSTHWPLVLAAMAGVSLSAVNTSSIGVMMEPIQVDLGWSRAQISLGISLISFIGMLLSTTAGLAIDRIGARQIGIISTTLMCGAMGLMSLVGTSLWQWWALWSVVGIAAAAMPTVWLAPISRSFSTSRGLAVAIALSGSGISGSLVPIIATSLVEHYGWRSAYLGIAGIWAVVVLPLVMLFFRNAPQVVSTAHAETKTEGTTDLPGLSVREGLISPAFYKLSCAVFLSMSAGVALILNLVPVLRSTGHSAATAAAIAGIAGVATIVGRLIGGWLMDRLDARLIASLSAAGAAALPLALLFFPGSVVAAGAGVAIYSLMGGAKVPAIVYLASRHFGPRAFGVLYGALNTMIGLGVGLGPLTANYVYDITQSYTPVMLTAAPFFLIAAILYMSLGQTPKVGSY